MARRVVLCLILSLLAAPALAEPDPDREKAKHLFQAGEQFYQIHEYEKAYEAYRDSYEISKEPVLLFDMAQCLRLLDRPDEAIKAYREFLAKVPDTQYREEIEGHIKELEAARAASTPPAGPGGSALTAPPERAPGEAPRASYKVPLLLAGVGAVAGGGALSVKHRLEDDFQGLDSGPLRRLRFGLALGSDLSFTAAAVGLGVDLIENHRARVAISPAPGGLSIALEVSP